MGRKSIVSEIGFADAELVASKKQSDALTVEVLAWNESAITITFSDVIRILDNDASSISAFCKVSDSGFLEAALSRLYEVEPPTDHPYVHYQFLDNDDFPALEVVSAQMNIGYS